MFNHEEDHNKPRDIEFAELANEGMEVGTKTVFTASSVFCVMQYLEKLSESCRFLEIFGPFGHYFEALGCFISAYYKWRCGDKMGAALDLAMALTVTITATVEFFALPFLASWGIALFMWKMYANAIIECFKEPSLEKIVDCAAWLCAASGTTLLALATTFPPLAPMLLPAAVVLCSCAGAIKAAQLLWSAGKFLFSKSKHLFFSQSTKPSYIEMTAIQKTETGVVGELLENEDFCSVAQNDSEINDDGEENESSLADIVQLIDKTSNDESHMEVFPSNDATFCDVKNEEEVQFSTTCQII